MTRFLKPFYGWPGDVLFSLVALALVVNLLGIDLLNSPNWPTGGDSASHVLYAKIYSEELLFSGRILPWLPEVFGGFPFLSYYFPLPFIVIASLSKLIGFAPAFKWGAFLAAMLLPGAVYVGGRRLLNLPCLPAFFGAMGALAFLLHEQHAIWGGNMASVFAGEFAYSYGVIFAILAMMAWARAVARGRGWVLAAVFEAASGFSHGFPLLVVGFSTALLLLDCNGWKQFRYAFGALIRGHLLAFMLLGGWLWPMLEMHGLTLPNDASYSVSNWKDLLPASLWPVLAAGLGALALMAVPAVRSRWTSGQQIALRYFASASGLAALGFIAGDSIGLADIRFYPMVLLLGAILCGWMFGQALAALGSNPGMAGYEALRFARGTLVVASCLGLLGWLGQHITEVPSWSLWNHAGLDSKPQWNNLSRLFPAMQGNLWSPRLVFEHDPINGDIGSNRSLEILPLFLNHRPVLEGLYMESAVLGPAIYQTQSEISATPSSPLVRFPSGSLDPEFAAAHMNFLHADMLLLRSDKAKAAIEASGLFERIAEAPPFSLYRLVRFDSRLVQVVTQTLSFHPRQDWMQDAFQWFRTRSRFNGALPVYFSGAEPPQISAEIQSGKNVHEIHLDRHEMVFDTDAIGHPHLVKMAYHPRWQLSSRGSLHIAAPGFMLVIPDEREIRLVYGHTTIGKLGMAATVTALFYLLFSAWPSRRSVTEPDEAFLTSTEHAGRISRWLPLIVGWCALAVAGTLFYQNSPERVYAEAWVHMRANDYKTASEYFVTAYERRKPKAKKEEALFWLARSLEFAGYPAEARARLRELCENYHGYWLPESLYWLAMVEKQNNQNEAAEHHIRRLREEFPANQWTHKLSFNKNP